MTDDDPNEAYEVEPIEPGPPGPGAVRNAVGIRYGVFPGNMKLSFQAARSIG